LVLLCGGLLALTFHRCPPVHVVWLGTCGALLLLLAACLLAWKAHWWFTWLPIAGVQFPLALGWALFSHTRRLAWEKAALEAKLVSAEGATLREASPGRAALESSPQVPFIPDHVLVKMVGRGAYGEIWLARNAIGTYHVVKIIRRASFDSDEPYEREFRGLQRFMPISRSHPGLVHILHVGRNDTAGIIYYIMEAADDEANRIVIDPATYSPCNLSRKIHARGHLEAQECLRLAVPLAAGLGHLHDEGLIHRDIKPANIIFVGGKPKLADIGLVTEAGLRGRDLSFVGTAGYIPPEGPGQPSADVYALGMVLYEAVMGLPRNSFPALPENALQRPDAELLLAINELILKACAPNSAERYATGAELEAAFSRLLDQSKTVLHPKN